MSKISISLKKSSNESISKGQITPPVMMAYLFRILFGPAEYGGRFTNVDNELLGIKGKTVADVEVMLRKVMLA
jgi:hypothetical protein